MNPFNKHVVFLCSRMDLPGGIERAIVNAANQLRTDNYQISILVLDCTATVFYPLHPDVQVRQYPLHFGITEAGNVLTRKIAFIKHLKKLRQLLLQSKAEVVIGTEYVFTIAAKVALHNVPIKVCSWEHHHFYWLKKSAFWNFLHKRIYPRTDLIICLNATEETYYKRLGCKTQVIPYYVERPLEPAPLNTKTILTVGWLIKRKGVDLIPAIAECVFKKHPDWKWRIIGTGPEYEPLEKSLKEKQLLQNIEIIKPTTNNLINEYLAASIYVMLSRFEGLPFVLLEASSFGVPCIAFDCLSGPSDIIQNNRDGLLIPLEDMAAMSNAILMLIENDALRKIMGENARTDVERFAPATVLQLWRQVLES